MFLSNGPGDPEPLEYASPRSAAYWARNRFSAFALGHQLLSLACGAKTFKMKFGHRGANQPVQRLDTGAVEITSQNHGFAVDEQSLPRVSRSDASQSERQYDRRRPPPGATRLQRAVSPRGLRRPAR